MSRTSAPTPDHEADNELNSWTSTIVALPIVMYTSWILYERSKSSPLNLLNHVDCRRIRKMITGTIKRNQADTNPVYGDKAPKKLVNPSPSSSSE